MSARIGLVTVLYNSEEVLPDFFQSLANQTFKDWWLYVIDNSPNENALKTAERLAMHHGIQNITLIYNNANLGVARGNNQGIVLSREQGCEYTLLLNNDISFDADTIANMVAHADDKSEALVVPKIYYAGSNRLWMAGGDISIFRGMTSHRGDGELDHGQYDKSEYIGYAPTCFMLIRNVVFDSVGTMDERYFVYFDDTDFVYRALRHGFRLHYFPQATVQHKVSFSTGGEESPFSVYYMNRNRAYFIAKNFNFPFKQMALFFFYTTRFVRYLQFTGVKRSNLVLAIKDGRMLCGAGPKFS